MLAHSESDFLMAYDTAPEVMKLVRKHRFAAVRLTMKSGHHNDLPELAITPDPWFS